MIQKRPNPLTVCLNADLRQAIREAAQNAGVKVNTFVVRVLKEAVKENKC